MYIYVYIKKVFCERLSLKKNNRLLDYDLDVLCKFFKERRNKVV